MRTSSPATPAVRELAAPTGNVEQRLRKFRSYELAHRRQPSVFKQAADLSSRVLPMLAGYLGAILMPFDQALMADAIFCVTTVSLLGSWFHDAVHGNVKPRLLRRFAARIASAPVGFSPAWWSYKHVRLHHKYVGNPDYDPDIQFGYLARVAPGQPWRRLHRTQHIHMWFLLPLATLNMLKPTEVSQRRRFGSLPEMQSAPRFQVYLVDKYVPFLAVWIPVVLVRGWIEAALIFGAYSLLAGALVSLITQVQHNTTLTVSDVTTTRLTLRDQLVRTADVGTQRGVWWWLSGGTNFHVLHHIVPTLSFLEVPGATRRLEVLLSELGLTIPRHKSMRAAILAHGRLLRGLSEPTGVNYQEY